jgi:hypothetical protein
MRRFRFIFGLAFLVAAGLPSAAAADSGSKPVSAQHLTVQLVDEDDGVQVQDQIHAGSWMARLLVESRRLGRTAAD